MQYFWQGVLVWVLTFSMMNVIKVKPHVPPFEKGPEYLEKYVTRHKKWVNKAEYYSWSTLFMEYAIAQHQNAIGDSLLAFGYPPDRQLSTSPYSITPLCAAVLSSNEHAVQSLLKAGADPTILPPDSMGALMSLSILNGFGLKSIKCFLEAGAPVDQVTDFSPPALTAAVQFGNYEIADLLIEHGADVDQFDLAGFSVLQYAAFADDLVSASYLRQKGADVNITNGFSSTPLCTAIHEQHENMVQYLLSEGANPDTSASRDRLPLAIALGINNYQIVNLLLQAGADIEKTDFSGRNFIISVFSNSYKIHQAEHQALIEVLLRDHFESVQTTWFHDVKAPQLFYIAAAEVLGEVMEKPKRLHSDPYPELTVDDSLDAATLLTAVRECSKLFIKYDLDISDLTRNGLSILHLLPDFNDDELSALIIPRFQNVSPADKNANTPLHYAVIKELPELMKQLLEAGAEVNAKNIMDLTALDYALISGRDDLINIIQQAGGVVGK